MKVTQDAVVDRQTRLNIEADSEELEKHLGRAHQRLAQRANVPGFRKGKAPRAVLERFVGRPHLVDEALETLVPELVQRAIEEHHLEPAATPRVVVEQRDPSLRLAVTVPLRPIVNLGDYRALRYDDQPETVTEEQVEETLDQLRDSQAAWEPVQRALQPGDMGVLTVTGTVEEKVVITGRDSEYVAQAGTPSPVPGFAEALVGMQAGDSRQFRLGIPEGFRDREAAGKDADFEVTLSAVKRKMLPHLDDELATSFGQDVATLSDLRAKIRENLEAAAEQVLLRSIEEKAVTALVESATFELPPLLVEHEVDHVLRDQQQALAANNVPVDAYMARVGKSETEIMDEARELADRRLRRSLAMDRVAELEEIEVSVEEIDSRLEQLRALPRAPDRSILESEAIRSSVAGSIRRERTVDRVMEIVRQTGDGARPRLEVPGGARLSAAVASDS